MLKYRLEKNGLVFLTIDRPGALNALNRELLLELKKELIKIRKEELVKVVIITGSGEKAFIAGADIKEMKDMSCREAKDFARLGKSVFKLIETSNKPFIAAINGYALGGGNELALSCDLRIASTNAKFGQPEVSLGIIPGFGGTQRLTELIGPAMAKEFIYTGKIINARKASEIGLVNRVVEADKLMDVVKEMANDIATNAPLAISYAKEAILYKQRNSGKQGLDFETNLFALCFNTLDQKNGMEGFLQKKEVKYEGK